MFSHLLTYLPLCFKIYPITIFLKSQPTITYSILNLLNIYKKSPKSSTTYSTKMYVWLDLENQCKKFLWYTFYWSEQYGSKSIKWRRNMEKSGFYSLEWLQVVWISSGFHFIDPSKDEKHFNERWRDWEI